MQALQQWLVQLVSTRAVSTQLQRNLSCSCIVALQLCRTPWVVTQMLILTAHNHLPLQRCTQQPVHLRQMPDCTAD
jgi:hypothetical protein